jgi:hypothetical protein
MEFRSVKSAVSFIKNLRTTRGYNSESTAEWRRLSMKLSDSALIQFARRLAIRLEVEKSFLVGVDEQDFNPKIYVLNRDSYCVLSATKRVNEKTHATTYMLGHIGDDLPSYELNVTVEPTDEDLACALSIIESKSLKIKAKRSGDDEKCRSPKCSSC